MGNAGGSGLASRFLLRSMGAMDNPVLQGPSNVGLSLSSSIRKLTPYPPTPSLSFPSHERGIKSFPEGCDKHEEILPDNCLRSPACLPSVLQALY